jgi:hypothetical protein
MEYTWADAWLLQSIARASLQSSATLADIIRTGDALNHAIFTAGELQQGLGKLLSDGLIRHESGCFSVGDRHAPLLRDILDRRQSPAKEMDAIGKLLNAPPYDARYRPPAFERGSATMIFSMDDYDRVCAAYRRDFQERYRTLKDKKDRA